MNSLTNEQKAYAIDKLKELYKTGFAIEVIYDFIWDKWNVTVDGWMADAEYDTLEEAIISASLRADKMRQE